ncbi:MAG: fumarate hydratase [Oscillospiraceae bacterium]|jgi:hypothetical protein|nr:fumarate hydratase [Oscillospiraceae bacterium]
MPEKIVLREKLARRAADILPPELAILIECAFEGESEPQAGEFLRGLIERFNECAHRAEPLHGSEKTGLYELELADDAKKELLIGIVPERVSEREAVITGDAVPGEAGFDELITDTALGLDISPLAPIVLGIGVASNEDEALELARRALFRPADRHATDAVTAASERRILARLNSRGPGAGGLGGRHTALMTAVECRGRGYIALAPGDYFTSSARAYY